MQKKLVVLTGAGISAESGINTFRDANGLWEGHDITQVASPQGFADNPALVLDFYSKRREQLLHVQPNTAHFALAGLEKHFEVHIITQNVDDLHERAGSTRVLHLHGELLKVRSTVNELDVYPWKKPLELGDICANGFQLRPHIVWFGEAVPLIKTAIGITQQADFLIIIGTSMQVYPAAGLVDYVRAGTPIYFIDPKPQVKADAFENLTLIEKTAVQGVPVLVGELLKLNYNMG